MSRCCISQAGGVTGAGGMKMVMVSSMSSMIGSNTITSSPSSTKAVTISMPSGQTKTILNSSGQIISLPTQTVTIGGKPVTVQMSSASGSKTLTLVSSQPTASTTTSIGLATGLLAATTGIDPDTAGDASASTIATTATTTTFSDATLRAGDATDPEQATAAGATATTGTTATTQPSGDYCAGKTHHLLYYGGLNCILPFYCALN